MLGRAVNPVVLIDHGNDFELLERKTYSPGVRNKVKNIWWCSAGPIVDHGLKEPLVGKDERNRRFTTCQLHLPVLVVIPVNGILRFDGKLESVVKSLKKLFV